MTDGTELPLNTLRLEGEMTIYRAEELRQVLMGAIQPEARLEIDLSGVTELDTCGLQLLMQAKRAATRHGGEVQLVRHSPPVLDVFELLNVAAFFGDHLVLPARTGRV